MTARSTGRLLAGAALICWLGGAAQATTFEVQITNTSSVPWSEGLITLQPLIDVGLTPVPPTNQYATYAFANSHCDISDGFCSTANCDDGDATILAGRWGLTLGVDAWLVPALDSGDSATVQITAFPGDRLSYVAWIALTSYFDDMVAIHDASDITDLSAPLFDAAGVPLEPIGFDISVYDVNSIDPLTGEATTCAQECPPPAAGCYVAPGNHSVGGSGDIPDQPGGGSGASGLTLAWSHQEDGYFTDGIALGNITGAAGREILVLLEGSGNYADPDIAYTGTGRAVVLSRDGTPQSAFTPPVGSDLMGLPLLTNLDDDSRREYVVCMPTTDGSCFARENTSTVAEWSSGPYGWAGWWNMGPSSGNVRADGANDGSEIVIADWNGEIRVLNRRTGAQINDYNVWVQHDESLSGHLSIGDVDGDGANEIVFAGYERGTVFALSTNDTDGTMSVTYMSDPLPNSGYVESSGTALADIDGDGELEMIVAASGSPAIYAYSMSHGLGCKYSWTNNAGVDYYWTSPVVGDVDADGTNEVVVLSVDSILSVLSAPPAVTGSCTEGTIEWEYEVGAGEGSWFTPALGQLSGASGVDVVAATYRTLEVIDVQAQTVAHRYSDSSAAFYPSAVIDRGSASNSTPGAYIYVSGWNNELIYRLDTPDGAPRPTRWNSFMGDNQRTGIR